MTKAPAPTEMLKGGEAINLYHTHWFKQPLFQNFAEWEKNNWRSIMMQIWQFGGVVYKTRETNVADLGQFWVVHTIIFFKNIVILLKAILQVLIYKASYDKSYLESKTTMTTGEWSYLISFTWAPLTCSERGGSEKFKMKIYVSSGFRTHTAPVYDRKVRAP